MANLHAISVMINPLGYMGQDICSVRRGENVPLVVLDCAFAICGILPSRKRLDSDILN